MLCTPSPARSTKTVLSSGVAIAALCLGFATGASAQDAGLTPTFGALDAATGFASTSVTIQAGGMEDYSNAGAGCTGFFATAPDYVINYDGGGSLQIEAYSNADTTLFVQDPFGNFLCNDDFNEVNPQITISGDAGGSTAIWVGTFNPIENNTYPDAELIISEGDPESTIPAPPIMPSQDIAATGFNALEAPTFGEVAVTSGFGAQDFDLQAGGMVDAFATNDACAGFIADVPDYTINFQDAGNALTLSVRSEVDTTLVVIAPDGSVNCNDDDVDLNPGLTIANALAGPYAVFVGTFSPIENDFYPDAVLSVASGENSSAQQGITARAAMAPTFGNVALASGFGTHSVDIQAGGFENASDIDFSCNGFVAEAPDYVVGFGGGDNLRITASSLDDTTMVVVTPTGQVLCNDDFNELNPGLITPDGTAGDYAIWIGTFNAIEGEQYPAATISVEEISTTKTQPSGAITATSLTAGFEPDPFTTVLAAGGVIEASSIDGFCSGTIAGSPDFVLSYTSGDWPLRFLVTSDADTTLVVRTPTGEVLCNDDSDGLNPAIALTSPASGQYEVFIGTFDPSAGFPEATLAITELLDQKELPPGALTQIDLGMGSTRQDFPLLAGGTFDAFEEFGSSCNGFVAGNPDFLATVSDRGVDIEMTVRSAEDTTLVVRGPDGTVMCDDDSGGDLNPMILMEGAQTGTYEVWLGTYVSSGHAPATLSLRDINAASGVTPNIPGGGKK